MHSNTPLNPQDAFLERVEPKETALKGVIITLRKWGQVTIQIEV